MLLNHIPCKYILALASLAQHHQSKDELSEAEELICAQVLDDYFRFVWNTDGCFVYPECKSN